MANYDNLLPRANLGDDNTYGKANCSLALEMLNSIAPEVEKHCVRLATHLRNCHDPAYRNATAERIQAITELAQNDVLYYTCQYFADSSPRPAQDSDIAPSPVASKVAQAFGMLCEHFKEIRELEESEKGTKDHWERTDQLLFFGPDILDNLKWLIRKSFATQDVSYKEMRYAHESLEFTEGHLAQCFLQAGIARPDQLTGNPQPSERMVQYAAIAPHALQAYNACFSLYCALYQLSDTEELTQDFRPLSDALQTLHQSSVNPIVNRAVLRNYERLLDRVAEAVEFDDLYADEMGQDIQVARTALENLDEVLNFSRQQEGDVLGL